MDASQHTPDTDTALRACSYGSWYPRYASLAPSSRVISLDAAFVDFLHEDGLVLPPESDAVSWWLEGSRAHWQRASRKCMWCGVSWLR